MGRTVSLLAVPVVALAALVGVVAGPAAAATQQVPRLVGQVRDACTGSPIPGATITLVGRETIVAFNEGDPDVPISTSVGPGVYAFAVTAPGYDPVGEDPATGTADGSLVITFDPPPSGLPAGEAVNETKLVSVRLVPNRGCPTGLLPPINLFALAGVVRNARTGLPILRATERLTPTSGEADPGPPQFGVFGAFAWTDLAPGSYQLAVSAPGFLGIGDPVGVNPGPAQIPVTRDPGPLQFPDGGSIVFGETLDVLLLPA